MNLINPDNKIFLAGTGMVGNAILKELKKKGYYNILNPKRSELDLLDSSAVNQFFAINKPKSL